MTPTLSLLMHRIGYMLKAPMSMSMFMFDRGYGITFFPKRFGGGYRMVHNEWFSF